MQTLWRFLVETLCEALALGLFIAGLALFCLSL
jgi:hypothetical protein